MYFFPDGQLQESDTYDSSTPRFFSATEAMEKKVLQVNSKDNDLKVELGQLKPAGFWFLYTWKTVILLLAKYMFMMYLVWEP